MTMTPIDKRPTPRSDAKAAELEPDETWVGDTVPLSFARTLEQQLSAAVEALTNIRDRTLTDAEGPELRCQNELNHREAALTLRAIEESSK